MKRPFLPIVLILFSATLSVSEAVHAQTRPANEPSGVLEGRDATTVNLVRQIDSVLEKRAQERGQTVRKFPDKIPFLSWEVTYKPQYDLIEVQLEQVVIISPNSNFNANPVLNEHPADADRPFPLGRPFFWLRVKPFVSPAEYTRLKAENEAIEKRLDEMYERMRRQHVARQHDRFMPKNEEEKDLVDAYNDLKYSHHDLPDFYFRNISLSRPIFWGDSRISTEMEETTEWQRDQVSIVQALQKLLSSYEPEFKEK